MLTMLEKIARLYSLITLFFITFLYQFFQGIINGSRYSFINLKNTLVHSFFELSADFIMLIIDILQALIDSIHVAWHKAVSIAHDFNSNHSK